MSPTTEGSHARLSLQRVFRDVASGQVCAKASVLLTREKPALIAACCVLPLPQEPKAGPREVKVALLTRTALAWRVSRKRTHL